MAGNRYHIHTDIVFSMHPIHCVLQFSFGGYGRAREGAFCEKADLQNISTQSYKLRYSHLFCELKFFFGRVRETILFSKRMVSRFIFRFIRKGVADKAAGKER